MFRTHFLVKKTSVYALLDEYAEQMSLINTKIYKRVEGLLYYRIARGVCGKKYWYWARNGKQQMYMIHLFYKKRVFDETIWELKGNPTFKTPFLKCNYHLQQ